MAQQIKQLPNKQSCKTLQDQFNAPSKRSLDIDPSTLADERYFTTTIVDETDVMLTPIETRNDYRLKTGTISKFKHAS